LNCPRCYENAGLYVKLKVSGTRTKDEKRSLILRDRYCPECGARFQTSESWDDAVEKDPPKKKVGRPPKKKTEDGKSG
jgi:transcriptional regulator NrdR family protein